MEVDVDSVVAVDAASRPVERDRRGLGLFAVGLCAAQLLWLGAIALVIYNLVA